MALVPAKGHAKYHGQMYPFAPGFDQNVKSVPPNGPFNGYGNAKVPGFFPPYPGYYPMQNPGFYPGFYPGYNPSVGVYPGYNPFPYPGVPSGFGAAMYPGYSNLMYPKFQPGYGNSPYPGLAGTKPSFGHHLPQEGEMRKIHRGRRQIKN